MLYYFNTFVRIVGVFVSSQFFYYFLLPLFVLVFIIISVSFIFHICKGVA